MVKIFFIFILTFFGTVLTAQTQNGCDDTTAFIVFGGPEDLPVFNEKTPDTELLSFLAENVEYPKTAIEDKVEGKVFIQFWIDTLGFTHEHKVVKGVREDLDNEALRVARLIKFDKPAKNRGKPIEYCYKLLISFTLDKKVSQTHKSKEQDILKKKNKVKNK